MRTAPILAALAVALGSAWGPSSAHPLNSDNFAPVRRPPPEFGSGMRGGPGFGPIVPGVAGGALVTLPPPERTEVADGWRQPPHRPPKRPPNIHREPPPTVVARRPPIRTIVEPTPQRVVAKAPGPPVPAAPVGLPAVAASVFPPPAGETRFRPDEVVVIAPPGASAATLAPILSRRRLIEVEAQPLATGGSLRLWRIPDGRAVASVIGELAGERVLSSVEPDYLYALLDDHSASAPPALAEYWLAKLDDDPALDRPESDPVRVAVIDTGIDAAHPDLAQAVEARFDAIGDGRAPQTLAHGTAVAGAIAARGRIRGVAPSARILTARAFDEEAGRPLGSTYSIMKAIDWAVQAHARVVNMSFAGPPDPALHGLLEAAAAKGVTLIAAAGNAGPKSPPLYPAADKSVVAVTATNADDAVYPMANAGPYVAVAAPGVDVLLPVPNGGYAMETGTSVSAALVSGVAALVMERRPEATPAEVRAWLETTARPLPRAEKDRVGCGLVDARLAVAAAETGAPRALGAAPAGF